MIKTIICDHPNLVTSDQDQDIFPASVAVVVTHLNTASGSLTIILALPPPALTDTDNNSAQLVDMALVTGELVAAEAVVVSGEETWAAVAGDTLPSGGAVVRELGAPGRAGDTLSSAGRRSTNL